MKKVLLLLLCVAFALSAFMGCEQAEESKADISESKNESQTESTDASEEVSETEESSPTEESDESEESDEISVVDIVCDAEGKHNANDSEIIYIDETHVYVLKGSSQDIIVSYSDGSWQNIKDALEEGNITIEDLDRFDISYTKIAKTDLPIGEVPEVGDKSDLVIIAILILPGAYNDTTILAYSDDEYDYYLPAMTKDNTVKCYINVYYSDESNQNVIDALADGSVTIEDLDMFGIRYTKVPKND